MPRNSLQTLSSTLRTLLICAVLVVPSLGAPGFAWAAAPTAPAAPVATPFPGDLALATSVSEENLRIADGSAIVIEIKNPDHWMFQPIDLSGADTGRFVVQGIEQETLAAPGPTERYTIRFALFHVGRFYFPPVRLEFVDAEGAHYFVESDCVSVKVASVLDDGGAGGLRKADGAVSIEEPDRRFAQGAILLLLALLLVGLGVLLARRLKGRNVAPAAPVAARPPWEVALERLRELQDAVEAGELEERPAYFRLSEIIREYIGGRFAFDALEMTTREIVKQLEHMTLPKGMDRTSFALFLSELDLVKFARQQKSAAETKENLGLAEKVVVQTRPKPAAADNASDRGGENAR